MPEVILDRGLVDSELFGSKQAFDGVRAERTEPNRRCERDRSGKHTQASVHGSTD
jgi:hypothetical protein